MNFFFIQDNCHLKITHAWIWSIMMGLGQKWRLDKMYMNLSNSLPPFSFMSHTRFGIFFCFQYIIHFLSHYGTIEKKIRLPMWILDGRLVCTITYKEKARLCSLWAKKPLLKSWALLLSNCMALVGVFHFWAPVLPFL